MFKKVEDTPDVKHANSLSARLAKEINTLPKGTYKIDLKDSGYGSLLSLRNNLAKLQKSLSIKVHSRHDEVYVEKL
jgi:hypothetical protein